MTIWELRFVDGRGASVYTQSDVSNEVGQAGKVNRIQVAAHVFEDTALSDTAACFREGRLLELSAHMGSVAYALRHELST
jgi:hypothetical protein